MSCAGKGRSGLHCTELATALCLIVLPVQVVCKLTQRITECAVLLALQFRLSAATKRATKARCSVGLRCRAHLVRIGHAARSGIVGALQVWVAIWRQVRARHRFGQFALRLIEQRLAVVGRIAGHVHAGQRVLGKRGNAVVSVVVVRQVGNVLHPLGVLGRIGLQKVWQLLLADLRAAVL